MGGISYRLRTRPGIPRVGRFLLLSARVCSHANLTLNRRGGSLLRRSTGVLAQHVYGEGGEKCMDVMFNDDGTAPEIA